MKRRNGKEITLNEYEDVCALFGVIFGSMKSSERDHPIGAEFGFGSDSCDLAI